MSPLTKVSVINDVKVQFGDQINQNDPNGLISKVDSATSDNFPNCSSLLLN